MSRTSRQSKLVSVSLSTDLLRVALDSAHMMGMTLEAWLSDAIHLASALLEERLDSPWGRESRDLFAAVAEQAPRLFEGKWRRLYALVDSDESLWVEETYEGSCGELLTHRTLNEAQLRDRWSDLVSEAFASTHPA